MFRAQTSIETLLVVAALLAFFAMLSPYYFKIAAASSKTILVLREQSFCDELYSKIMDAKLLPGSTFTLTLIAPTNATIYFDEELHCNFSTGKNFTRNIGNYSVNIARGKKFNATITSNKLLLVPTNE